MTLTGLDLRGKAKGGISKGKDGIDSLRGKGKTDSMPERQQPRPLNTLKDPYAFGAPPKNVNYHGGTALPNQNTPHTGSLGDHLSSDEVEALEAYRQQKQRQQQEEESPKGPPLPFRADTTGLDTSHLPPPPTRRDGADGRSPPPAISARPKPPGPALPPRLPPRQNTNPRPSPPSSHASSTDADIHKGILNQGALNRLGAAGVSVPGFGIENKSKPGLPPPPSASPSRNSPPFQAPSNNASQLNELQSRFSRLNKSTDQKPESSSEGTTWAQKQAALKTASSFRNDPSSVSLNDARNAASTANNFRERHGEQVKTGWQSANKLNTKYGIADKANSYGGQNNAHVEEPEYSGIEMQDNEHGSHVSSGQSHSIADKKKPPPPPAKKAGLAGSGIPRNGGVAPPPIPLSTKPKPQSSRSPEAQNQAQAQAQDLDLDLKSLWFAKSPPEFPPPALRNNKKMGGFATSMSTTGSDSISFTSAIRISDTLGITIIHITWSASNPGATVKAQQRHLPPPRSLNRGELDVYRDRYSDAVADWTKSQMGRQVGNGECWTLANDALKAVAAQCASRREEPCMSSQSYKHGDLIYSYIPANSPYPSPKGGVHEAGICRGDIIQLYSAHFKSRDGGQKWAGAPDHTAVITGVDRNGILKVVEQNVGGSKKVQAGEYVMNELVSGEVRVYRVVGLSWIGELVPQW